VGAGVESAKIRGAQERQPKFQKNRLRRANVWEVDVEQFEFVFALLSVMVGLGLTHILSAMGTAIHRLRGRGAPIKLDAIFLLWVGVMLTWLISAWWGEYKLQTIDFVWTFGAYLFFILYYISLFLVIVILVPSRLENVADTYLHFMNGRAWFFGALLVATILDFFDTMMKGADWAFRPEYFISQSGLFVVVSIVGWIFKPRWVQITIAAAALLSQLIYIWRSLNVLGSF